jgi:predicted enzyme related to lactoylglutathione lyase
MPNSIGLIVYPVTDLARAKALYRVLLSVEPYVDQPAYVGFRVAALEIGLDPHGHRKGLTGPLRYWPVDDRRRRLQAVRDAGGQVQQDATDVGGCSYLVCQAAAARGAGAR